MSSVRLHEKVKEGEKKMKEFKFQLAAITLKDENGKEFTIEVESQEHFRAFCPNANVTSKEVAHRLGSIGVAGAYSAIYDYLHPKKG